MDIEARHHEHPEQRIAQKALAREIITDLHGEAEFTHAVEVSEKLFAGDFKSLSARDIKSGMKNVPQVSLTPGPLADALVAARVCSSKREAREFIGNGAISINGEVVKDATWELTPAAALEGGIVIIRRGKKKFYMGEFA